MIIDADSHYVPVDTFKYVDEQFRHLLPRFSKDIDGKFRVKLDNDPNPWSENPLPPHFHNNHLGFNDLEMRLIDFEKLHIDFQILNPQEHAMRFSYAVEKELAKQMAYSWNRILLDTIKLHPSKFHGPLLLPLQDIDWSLNEIDWGLQNGFSSVLIDTAWFNDFDPYSSLLITMPGIDKIFKKCADNDILISFHHQMHQKAFTKNITLTAYQVHNLFPSHHKLLLITLVTSGILDKYPNLKVLISEGGMKFIMESFNYLENRIGKSSRKYFTENFWFTIEPEETIAFKSAVLEFGSERFLFATDYPHEDRGGQMKFQDWKLIENLDFDQRQLDDICYRNAINIFKLDINK